ncbi:MAG: 2Fe-2S iron-sulfur cluster-binding protein [Candidatus Nanopelagicales bacterium]|jgi:sarcosine oxidase, subunit alpha|nr:2Fe-2S iron-sulfur cluster-binding protein [Candidatus Nanopelagicales bacterium]MDP4667012.1 2Fe-2S iron-sulfur cluster-binding protein [Candidatus Nanopelagicales bacterium]MDP4895689.1 2Fe-2S iron-sulfur cluster-binding protein [Candidatus Nanopelagicales bacterium]MDP5050525.1 2Fe-2S iron-sulfur cluster-binding protein [Candidatus Nanopelagicales bacterium]
MSKVNFTFDGKQYSGEKGESLASALLRNGVLHFTDSSYKDRPRGVMGLWVEETNALVNIDSGAGEPLKPATTVELVEGLIARSAQGVGDLPDTRDNSRYDKANRHVDVLVVGAGTAGLEAAKKFSDLGKSVMIMDDKPTAGGHLVYLGQSVPAELLEVLERENVTYLPRTTVQGLYDQGFSVATERRTDHLDAKVHTEMSRIRTWHVRAEHTVLATGAFQRHLVFANNDRPGIMLSHAAATYVANGANPFKTAVVVTIDNQGYRDALRLSNAGVTVNAIVDIRKDPSGPSVAAAKSAGIQIITGKTAIDSCATEAGTVKCVSIGNPDGSDASCIDGDLVAVSGGWTPIVHLATFIGIKPTWDAKLAAFVVKRSDALTSTVGMLAGEFGGDDDAAIFFGPELSTEQALVAFVDYQRDATYRDFKRAIDAGMRSIEHVKRYTAIGTAHDQGKTSGTVTMGLIGQAIGKAPDEIGSLTFRPPYISIPFAALAGRDRGLLSDPERTTPIHAWHKASGAPMEDVGQWKRPWYFPKSGENMHAAVLRECAAVRQDVGVMDASTLGKIDIQGKDAGQFLDMIYTNMFSTLKVGMSRYGLMCGIDGMVFDDGVTTRISENHWLMTTTTGGAAKVLDWLEEWLQTEWPHLEVYCTSVTEQISTVAIVGPKSRELMSRLAPALDVTNESFAFMENKHADVAGVPARIARISFSGELAYEINVPAVHGLHIWESVMAHGADLNITPYGTETMHVLRAEKGFVIVGQETDGTQTPQDLDMDWIVSKKKDDFIGKRSFSRADTAREGRHQLVGILADDGTYVIPEGAYLVAGADSNTPPPVKHIGYITSSYDSAALGRSFALALVANGLARKGEKIAIPMADRVVTGVITDSVFVDKENTRRDG